MRDRPHDAAQSLYDAELTEAIDLAKNMAHLQVGTYKIDSRLLSLGDNNTGQNMDWFLAIGHYAAWGKGTVKVCANTVVLNFTYTLVKRYQWEMGLDKSVSILGVEITDDTMGEFSEAGLAKEFNIKATKSAVVRIPK